MVNLSIYCQESIAFQLLGTSWSEATWIIAITSSSVSARALESLLHRATRETLLILKSDHDSLCGFFSQNKSLRSYSNFQGARGRPTLVSIPVCLFFWALTAHSPSARAASCLFLKRIREVPASGPLHWSFLPGIIFIHDLLPHSFRSYTSCQGGPL